MRSLICPNQECPEPKLGHFTINEDHTIQCAYCDIYLEEFMWVDVDEHKQQLSRLREIYHNEKNPRKV